MSLPYKAVLLVVASGLAVPALAQNPADAVQRNVNQQQRIEQGIQSGQLTNREVSNLEKGQAT